jgi:hypothetical protein
MATITTTRNADKLMILSMPATALYAAALNQLQRDCGFVRRRYLMAAFLADFAAKRGVVLPSRIGVTVRTVDSE